MSSTHQLGTARVARRAAVVAARGLTRLVLAGLVAAIVGALVVVAVLPRTTDAVAMTVLTGSMTPTIPAGSMILVRPVDPGTLQVGDIATYQEQEGVDTYITHRVVGVRERAGETRYVFQGDANPGPDLQAVRPGAVRGEVWFHVPYLGSTKESLGGPAGVGLLAMLLLAGFALTQLVGGLVEVRRGRSRAPDQPDRTDHTREDRARAHA